MWENGTEKIEVLKMTIDGCNLWGYREELIGGGRRGRTKGVGKGNHEMSKGTGEGRDLRKQALGVMTGGSTAIHICASHLASVRV